MMDKEKYQNDIHNLSICVTMLESIIHLTKFNDDYKTRCAKKAIELQQEKFSKIISQYDVTDESIHKLINDFTSNLIIAKELL